MLGRAEADVLVALVDIPVETETGFAVPHSVSVHRQSVVLPVVL